MTTYSDLLEKQFPNIRDLDEEFYIDEPYKNNNLRRSKILLLQGSLSNYEGFRLLTNEQQNSLVRKIESGCVNNTIKKAREDNITPLWETPAFIQRYNVTIYEVATELDYTQNTFLAPKVVSGEIGPYKVSALSAEESNPDRNMRLKEKSEARRNQTIQTKTVTMECPECHNEEKRCTVKNVQIRGLDEAKTTIAMCCFCDHEWTVEK
jgi:DNA-directed RNA polymerase subunit M/transcription elongation factor TFIIS